MANNKSSKKRIKIIAKKTLRNKIIKSQTKTAIKKFLAVVETGNKQDATLELRKTVAVIDKAASRGIFHKNNAARKKSKLAKMVNKIGA